MQGGGGRLVRSHSDFGPRTGTDKNRCAPCLLMTSVCARPSAELVLASAIISGFNQLSRIVSLRPGDRPMGKFGARISGHRQRGSCTSVCCTSLFRRRPGVLSWRVLIVAALLAAPRLAFASGEERTTVGDDLLIRTDTRWAGGTLGGYLPVRVEIANHAAARTLVFEVTPADRSHGATVKRVVTRGSAGDGPFHASHSAHGVPTGVASRLRLARRVAIALAPRCGCGVPERRVDPCDARGLVPADRLLELPPSGHRRARGALRHSARSDHVRNSGNGSARQLARFVD